MTLAEALAQVNLVGGQTYNCVVNGKQIIVRVADSGPVPASHYDESDVMLDAWAEFPTQPGIEAEVLISPLALPHVPYIPQDES